jgi:hypothetical protein
LDEFDESNIDEKLPAPSSPALPPLDTSSPDRVLFANCHESDARCGRSAGESEP